MADGFRDAKRRLFFKGLQRWSLDSLLQAGRERPSTIRLTPLRLCRECSTLTPADPEITKLFPCMASAHKLSRYGVASMWTLGVNFNLATVFAECRNQVLIDHTLLGNASWAPTSPSYETTKR